LRVKESLLETEKQLKNDLDKGNFPEWWRLMVILRFQNLPDAEMTMQPKTGSIHMFSSIPSDMEIRRAIPDCRGRLYVSERRKQMIGAFGDIIYRKGKGRFKFKMVKGKLIVIWTRKPQPDIPIDLRDVLRLPFKACPPQHVKRHLKWWKRFKGKMKEVRKEIERRRRRSG